MKASRRTDEKLDTRKESKFCYQEFSFLALTTATSEGSDKAGQGTAQGVRDFCLGPFGPAERQPPKGPMRAGGMAAWTVDSLKPQHRLRQSRLQNPLSTPACAYRPGPFGTAKSPAAHHEVKHIFARGPRSSPGR